MPKKFYAVKRGKKVGIYNTWEKCKEQVTGFPNAEYKGFPSLEDAKLYLDGNIETKAKPIQETSQTDAVAYVDGSYDVQTNNFSYGVVMFYENVEQHFSEKYSDIDLAEMHNVAGEIKGAERAIKFCLDNHIPSISIYHDYEGIAKWCTGEWKAKKDGTKAYKDYYDKAANQINIRFVKVQGHSGNKYNDLADELAKTALGLGEIAAQEDDNMAKKSGVFIDRDQIVNTIRKIGAKEWGAFEASELQEAGTHFRSNINADGKKAMLDFFFNIGGTTTIFPTGSNTEISSKIKILLEAECAFQESVAAESYSFKKLSETWRNGLVEFLTTLEGVEAIHTKVDTQPPHDCYQFKSKMGDRLTLNLYLTGTLTLQGKPAYLYGEAISFLSYCNNVSVEDIVATTNKFHNMDIKTDDIRAEMKALMPNTYGAIDDTIFKLLSPSFSLKKIIVPLEDYSCYAFPALRALEGYIKYLFSLKNIKVGYTFGGIFDHGQLTTDTATKISDVNFQAELVNLFDYFRKNRYVIFHTEQILIGTTILENKAEADEIVNEVIHLIETSYISIKS